MKVKEARELLSKIQDMNLPESMCSPRNRNIRVTDELTIMRNALKGKDDEAVLHAPLAASFERMKETFLAF